MIARAQQSQQQGLRSGILVALLFGAGNALWAFRIPRPGAPGAEVQDFYRERSGRIAAGASLSLVSIGLFVFFASAVRRLIAESAKDEVLATTAFGGALLGSAAGLGAETINMTGAMRARSGQLDEPLARSIFETSQVLGFNAAGVGIGTFAISTAAAALRSDRVLPRWLAAVTALVGGALFTPLCRVVFGPAVALLGVVASVMARRAGRT